MVTIFIQLVHWCTLNVTQLLYLSRIMTTRKHVRFLWIQCTQKIVCRYVILHRMLQNQGSWHTSHARFDIVIAQYIKLCWSSHHKWNWFLLLLSSSQGKSFVKDALRCMALGLRQRFSCVSRRCSAVKEMVFSLQRECYSKHQLCLALRDHMDTMGNLVQFHLMFPSGWETYTNTNKSSESFYHHPK